MNATGANNNRSRRRFFLLAMSLLCLYETVFAQTFHFSRGWTNGKKRSSLDSFYLQDSGNGERPEMLGLCRMQKLREIWESRHLDREYLPCEVIGIPEADIVERPRRKTGCDRNTILDSPFTGKPN